MEVTSQIYYLHFWCVKTLILGGGVTAGVTKWGYICRKVGLQNSFQHPPVKWLPKNKKRSKV